MKLVQRSGYVLALSALVAGSAHADEGDPARGARVFRACAACHSLEPGRNLTGPSLAGVWDRKAGSVESFTRYSPALKNSGVVWDAKALDAWLKDPKHFIPGNRMTFPGLKDAQARSDLIAFLKDAGRGQVAETPQGGMSGMMGAGSVPNLKKLAPEDRVRAITYCGDTYHVTTDDGETTDFWERNLRFKTDSSADGPEKGAPAILGAGMMGDRASVIFATPDEISATVKRGC